MPQDLRAFPVSESYKRPQRRRKHAIRLLRPHDRKLNRESNLVQWLGTCSSSQQAGRVASFAIRILHTHRFMFFNLRCVIDHLTIFAAGKFVLPLVDGNFVELAL